MALRRSSRSVLLLGVAIGCGALRVAVPPAGRRSAAPQMVATAPSSTADEVTAENPLRVLIAGAGVGGLALANQLELSDANVEYTVLE